MTESSESPDYGRLVFEDIARLDDAGVQRVLRELYVDELCSALVGAPEAVQRTIFRNVSQRAGEMIRQRIEALEETARSDVVAARQRTMDVVRRLAVHGALTVAERPVDAPADATAPSSARWRRKPRTDGAFWRLLRVDAGTVRAVAAEVGPAVLARAARHADKLFAQRLAERLEGEAAAEFSRLTAEGGTVEHAEVLAARQRVVEAIDRHAVAPPAPAAAADDELLV